jgi:hypothetical protein
MHGLDDIITPGSNDNPFQAFLKKKESFLFFYVFNDFLRFTQCSPQEE